MIRLHKLLPGLPLMMTGQKPVAMLGGPTATATVFIIILMGHAMTSTEAYPAALMPALVQTANRTIVTSLTAWLQNTLQKSNTSVLVVIPWSSSSSSGTNRPSTTSITRSMQIDWQSLNTSSSPGVGLVVYQVHSLQQFVGVQPKHVRHHRLQGHGTRVAVLVQGSNGVVNMQQLALANAISKRLRRAHTQSLQYSNHAEMADSLVLFDGTGVPVEAAFLSTSIHRDAFTAIYDKQVWGPHGGGSGQGSSLERTEKIRATLLDVITRYNITSLLDSSCGSMLWMPLVLKEAQTKNPEFRFKGTDVVCSLIERHKITYANTSWSFECVDYANQLLPSGYDLVFSRDSLQHVPMHAVWQFLNNVKATGAKWLLVGSYVNSIRPNIDIKGGEFYEIDILKEPFRVQHPVEVIAENDVEQKHMLLYNVANMTWQDTLQGVL